MLFRSNLCTHTKLLNIVPPFIITLRAKRGAPQPSPSLTLFFFLSFTSLSTSANPPHHHHHHHSIVLKHSMLQVVIIVQDNFRDNLKTIYYPQSIQTEGLHFLDVHFRHNEQVFSCAEFQLNQNDKMQVSISFKISRIKHF